MKKAGIVLLACSMIVGALATYITHTYAPASQISFSTASYYNTYAPGERENIQQQYRKIRQNRDTQDSSKPTYHNTEGGRFQSGSNGLYTGPHTTVTEDGRIKECKTTGYSPRRKSVTFFNCASLKECQDYEKQPRVKDGNEYQVSSCNFGSGTCFCKYLDPKGMSNRECSYRDPDDVPKDYDDDGVTTFDNCSRVYNPGQEDADYDGIGDACDEDSDNDGIKNEDDENPTKDDDFDDDGVLDRVDNCKYIKNPSQTDSDGDTVGDACDNCVDTPNTDQYSTYGYKLGNACNDDRDQDGYTNENECCPRTRSQVYQVGDSCSVPNRGTVNSQCMCEGEDGRTEQIRCGTDRSTGNVNYGESLGAKDNTPIETDPIDPTPTGVRCHGCSNSCGQKFYFANQTVCPLGYYGDENACTQGCAEDDSNSGGSTSGGSDNGNSTGGDTGGGKEIQKPATVQPSIIVEDTLEIVTQPMTVLQTWQARHDTDNDGYLDADECYPNDANNTSRPGNTCDLDADGISDGLLDASCRCIFSAS